MRVLVVGHQKVVQQELLQFLLGYWGKKGSASYMCVLEFVLLKKFKPRLQNRILIPLRLMLFFQVFDNYSSLFLYGSAPPPPRRPRIWAQVFWVSSLGVGEFHYHWWKILVLSRVKFALEDTLKDFSLKPKMLNSRISFPTCKIFITNMSMEPSLLVRYL